MASRCNLDFLEDDLFEEDVRKNRKKSNTFQFAARPGAAGQRPNQDASSIDPVVEEESNNQ